MLSFLSFGTIQARADSDPNPDLSPLDRPDYDPDHAFYQIAPSRWAMGLRAAINAFPFNSAVGNSYQLFGEWVLPFQNMGLFSLGGHFGSFPINTSGQNLATYIPVNYSSMMGGLQFRYQFRYSKFQLFVPTVAIEPDYYAIRLGSNGPNTTTTTGIIFSFDAGFMINMGWIDRDTARDAYQTIALTRSYLTFEIHPLSISDSNISVSGTFFYSGLRLEFE